MMKIQVSCITLLIVTVQIILEPHVAALHHPHCLS